MGLGTKLALGAVAAGLVPVAAAAPVGAIEGQDSEQISRTVGKLTCRVAGTSSYTYSPDTDVTHIATSSGVFDDPGCRDALFSVETIISYESPAGSGRFLTASARGVDALEAPDHKANWYVSSSISIPGPTGAIEVAHRATFLCSTDPRPSFCSGTATTNPK